MSESPERPDRPHGNVSGEAQTGGDVQSLLKHVQDNPLVYVGGAVFLVFVALVAVFFRISQNLGQQEAASVYMRAIEIEEPLERAAALAAVADGKSTYAARALYLQGEAALEGLDYDGAVAAFEQLRERYSDVSFLPDAVEGIGFAREEQEAIPEALAIYREVQDKWPDTAAARRQPNNIGRCLEEQGDLEGAVASYRKQLETFPGTGAAFDAQQRLTELRTSNPELFEMADAGETASTFPTPSLDTQVDIGEALSTAPTEE